MFTIFDILLEAQKQTKNSNKYFNFSKTRLLQDS